MQSLNRAQILDLLQRARASRERDWLMILVAFLHGLRASEVVQITRDDLGDDYLTVQRLKGSAKTVQKLFGHADPLLDERSGLIAYAGNFHGKQRLFPICRQHFWRLVQRYGREAGIPGHLCHPHILKHSIAMQTIHQVGIENVRQHLGHKSMASTGAYLKVDDEAASDAIGGALKGPAS